MTRPEAAGALRQSYMSGCGPNRTGVSVSSTMPDSASESDLFRGQKAHHELHSELAATKYAAVEYVYGRKRMALLTIAKASNPA